MPALLHLCGELGDGSVAGRLVESRSFWSDEVEAEGDLRCARVRLGYLYYEDGVPEDGALRMCVPASRVSEPKPLDRSGVFGKGR